MSARDALEMATLGSAACLGRTGELGVLAPGAVADLVAWRLDGIRFAGAVSDPVEAWLRCGPVAAHHTVVAGRAIVEDGQLTAGGVEDVSPATGRRRSASRASTADERTPGSLRSGDVRSPRRWDRLRYRRRRGRS